MEVNNQNVKFLTLVKTQQTHAHYDRVTALEKEYSAHITGEGIADYLKQFTPRESVEMFAQRVQLTNAISPAVASSLMKPFYKVSRNNNVTESYDFKNPTLNTNVATMLEDFNGEKVDDTDGFKNWLKTRFLELSFADPNAFVVLEWDAAMPNQIIKPRPFEVSSHEAKNFEFKGQELQWLFVSTKIKYYKDDGNGKTKAEDGFKYTFYAIGKTLVLQQVDKDFYLKNYKLNNGEEITELNGLWYLWAEYDTNLTFVPAFRVGYARDLYTRGKTFVNPFHAALTYFRKSLKTVSELDITMTAHVFPQKLQYVQKCNGASVKEPCDGGRNKNGGACTACNGTGYRSVTSAQEVLNFPMPELKDEFFPLDQMLVYKAPPIEIVKFQEEYVTKLEQKAHLAVFSSNMFITPDAQFAKTATEIDSNMEGIYDAIEPFTEKFSKVFKFVVYTSAALAGFNQTSADFTLIHSFPPDPKLKTTGVLLAELKAANESGAPAFVRQILSTDIAEIVFSADAEALLKFKTRNLFAPYNGKSESEISLALASQYTSELTKVLYINFDAIFTEIEKANPKFYNLPYKNQSDIVAETVIKWRDQIMQAKPITVDFSNVGKENGVNSDQNNNGGENDTDGEKDAENAADAENNK